MAILQRALPLYAKLVSLRPGSQWDPNAFESSRVVQRRSAQQGNGSDCGPATLATILHIINDKPHETSINGEGLRSSYLRVLHHYMHGFGSQQWPLSHSTGAASSGPQHLTSDDPAVIDAFDSGHSFLERFQLSSLSRTASWKLGFQFIVWNSIVTSDVTSMDIIHITCTLLPQILEPGVYLRHGQNVKDILFSSPHFLYNTDETITPLHEIRSLEPTILATALRPNITSGYADRRLELGNSTD